MDTKHISELTDKLILRKAQRSRNVTQEKLADTLGVKQNTLSGNMRRDRMSLGVFGRILTALDYDIVIVDRETGEAMWKLETERPDLDDDI
jgi:transcriptional regulator with XRE-family HTH domain